MNEELNLLLEEKIYQIQNDLNRKKIEAKTMAEFAIVFYEKYKENYNEKLLIQICKRTMNFYEEGLKNLPNKDKEYFFETTIFDISKTQEKLNSFLKNIPQVDSQDLIEKINIENIEDIYRNIIKQLNTMLIKKPSIFGKRKWKKNLEDGYNKLNQIKEIIENYQEKEKNSESNKRLEKNFKDLMEDLKNFSYNYDKEIGVKLVTITYEDVMKNEDILKNFIYEVVISNLYNYFIKVDITNI